MCKQTLWVTRTLLLKLVDVPDDGPEERSLLGVIGHAVGHELSQLLAVWGGQLALHLIKPLLLLRTNMKVFFASVNGKKGSEEAEVPSV